MSDERFVCACWCLALLAIVCVVAAVDIYKFERSNKCAEACPCQKKQGANYER